MSVVVAFKVHSEEITFTNLQGKTIKEELHFLIDPYKLMVLMSDYTPKKVRSGNPALNGKDAPVTDREQLEMVRSLVIEAAGWPSEDGNGWVQNYDFPESLAGKTFLAKLVASDEIRKSFTQVAILEPFRTFVTLFEAVPENTEKEKEDIRKQLAQMENIFKAPSGETAEQRRQRLTAELAQLEDNNAPSE
jgi:hypothetical protein